MTPAELKRLTQETSPHFFTRSTMSFFGDTMKNYGVRKATILTHWKGDEWTKDGHPANVWELYRKRPVKHGRQSSAYFCRKTFRKLT